MIKKLFAFFFPNGFKFKINKHWPGEKNLPYPNKEPDISNRTIEKEIKDSFKKE